MCGLDNGVRTTPRWEGNTKGMEDTVQRNKRGLKKQTGNGGHSKIHAQSDAGKEKGNGGHFLEKQKGKARKSQVGRKHRGNGGHSPEKQKGNWGSKRKMEDTLNIMRRRTRGRKRGMEDTF